MCILQFKMFIFSLVENYLWVLFFLEQDRIVFARRAMFKCKRGEQCLNVLSQELCDER